MIKIGDYVYMEGSPEHPGKVVAVKEIWEQRSFSPHWEIHPYVKVIATVKWATGSKHTGNYETEVLSNYDLFVSKLNKQYEHHKALIEELKQL